MTLENIIKLEQTLDAFKKHHQTEGVKSAFNLIKKEMQEKKEDRKQADKGFYACYSNAISDVLALIRDELFNKTK